MEPIPIRVIDFHVGMMPFQYMSTNKVHEKASYKVSTIPRNQGHVNLLENVMCGVDATMNVVIVLFSRG
jgi:hypothetical protein